MSAVVPASRRAGPGRLSLAAAAALFSALFAFNAYVCDDAFISFRTIDNFVRGFGLRWNPAERVQVFTAPLHTLLTAGLYWFSHDRAWLPNPGRIYATALALSYVLSLATLWLFARGARSAEAFWPGFLLLTSSQAFVTFTSSGLETPLTYLLLVLFYGDFLRGGVASPRRCFWLLLWASLSAVNRLDTALLVAPAAVWLLWRGGREHGRGILAPAALAALPLLLWLAFAVLYYGFPLPNTYYAKIGIGADAALLQRMGLSYLGIALIEDPVTLGTLVGAALWAAARRDGRAGLAALGALLYVGYIHAIGGDFLGFRFLAPPFLISALLVQRLLDRRRRAHPARGAGGRLVAAPALAVAVLLYAAATPGSPWRAWRELPKADDVRFYYLASNPLRWRPGSGFPFAPFREFRSLEQCREWRSPEPVASIGGGGLHGFCVGPHHHLVMPAGITDPLMARLPARAARPFLPGHLFKPLPEGYLESVATGRNALSDPELARYYDDLLAVIRGPLLRADRWRSIAKLNLTSARRYRGAYPERRDGYPKAFQRPARSLVEKLRDRSWLERQRYAAPFVRLFAPRTNGPDAGRPLRRAQGRGE